MGLDATVYCDCFEKGRVRTLPPQPELVYIEPTGQLSLRWDAPHADQHAFYGWLADSCAHGPMGELVSHRLGNFALIGWLREILSKTPSHFPVLLTKVLYDAGHAGAASCGVSEGGVTVSVTVQITGTRPVVVCAQPTRRLSVPKPRTRPADALAGSGRKLGHMLSSLSSVQARFRS